MLPIMLLLYLFRQALSLTISPILRTTIFFTEAIHTTILYTCNLMQDLLENNSEKSNSDESLLTIMTSNHNSDLISSNHNDCVSTCSQTEKQPISSFRNKKAKNTEVIIHNVDSSKKVIVIQNSSSKEKRKSARRNCKSGTRALFRKKETVLKNELTKQSPGKNQCSSDSSNMSLENDVSDAKIIDYSQNISLPKSAHQCNLSLSPSKNNLNRIKSPKVSYEISKPEISRNIELPVIETPEEYDGSQQHKTSSPVEHIEEDEWAKCWNSFSKNQAKNETFKKFSDLYQTIENVQKYNTNTLESTFVSDNKIKRRSSLPAKFNQTNEATIDLTLFCDQIIEEVINSPRSKRDSTDLKFPIPLKEYLVNKHSNEINDSKGGILSSSSYESLPVSDNFQSVVERNPMYLHKSSTDDVNSNFSSVDDLIEAFQKVKDELTVLKAVKKKMPSKSSFNDNSAKEINCSENSETGVSLECKYSEKSACETQKDNLDTQIVPETVSDDVRTLTPYFSIDIMKQRSQYPACRTFSNDLAISNPDNSAVDAIEAMLNIITTPLH